MKWRVTRSERLARFFHPARLARRVRSKSMTAGVVIVVAFYAVAVFAEFIAPYHYRAQSRREPFAPATRIYFYDEQGRFAWRPFIRRSRVVDPLTNRYREEVNTRFPLRLWVRGYSYNLPGIWRTDRHLFGVDAEDQNAPRLHLLGTDRLGRDRFARLLVAARFSLVVAPLAVLLAVALGAIVGGVAGYAGRSVDALLMRIADAVIALPTLVLVLALRATQPLELPPLRAGILLVVILAALGWAEIARLTRGLVLALRTREYVLAAVSIGAHPARILVRHILPNAARPLIAHATLMLPTFLLAETALSYFGAGLQEPEPGWGNMLAAAGDLNALAQRPFLLLAPALPIFAFVFGVRLVGDGLSDKGRSYAVERKAQPKSEPPAVAGGLTS